MKTDENDDEEIFIDVFNKKFKTVVPPKRCTACGVLAELHAGGVTVCVLCNGVGQGSRDLRHAPWQHVRRCVNEACASAQPLGQRQGSDGGCTLLPFGAMRASRCGQCRRSHCSKSST